MGHGLLRRLRLRLGRWIAAAEKAIDIDVNVLVAGAAQQVIDRHAQSLPDNVPQGRLQAAQSAHVHASAETPLPMSLYLKGVGAAQLIAQLAQGFE